MLGEHTIEHFRLVAPIGDGHFGVGFSAIDLRNGNLVCVKIFKQMTQISEKTLQAEI